MNFFGLSNILIIPYLISNLALFPDLPLLLTGRGYLNMDTIERILFEDLAVSMSDFEAESVTSLLGPAKSGDMGMVGWERGEGGGELGS